MPPAEARVFAGSVRLHILDHAGGVPPIVLLHGLSANSHHFDGLAAAGLAPVHRVLAPDLRGRGLSDKPATGYGMAEHAADVVGLLDALGLERVVMGGHSFGALLSLYLAGHAPDRVERVVMLDAAASLHPDVRDLIAPSLARLAQRFPSADAYIAHVRAMPFLRGFWHPLLEGTFRHELEPLPDGQVGIRTSAAAIAEALDRVLAEPWAAHVPRVAQPVLLIRAPEGYGPPGAPPILPEAEAMATVRALRDCRYVETSGNHLTMLFGEHGHRTARAILEFLRP